MYPFTLAGAAVLVGGGAGAYLTIIRLSSGGTHKPPDGKINVNTFLNAVQRYPNTRSMIDQLPRRTAGELINH